jgi:hypothetical protein
MEIILIGIVILIPLAMAVMGIGLIVGAMEKIKRELDK